MLNIEIIKFEAQDVITASNAAPSAHEHLYLFTDTENENGELIYRCECGDEIAMPDDRAE